MVITSCILLFACHCLFSMESTKGFSGLRMLARIMLFVCHCLFLNGLFKI